MADTARLTILRGLPGSGKSTHARAMERALGAVVLSRDSMRDMLHPSGHEGVLTSVEENIISDTLRAIAVRLLGEGREVVIDATNLRDKYVREWARVAHGRGHRFDIGDFRGTALQVCLERNAQRERPVPEEVIRDMHQRFVKGRDFLADNQRITNEVLAGIDAKPELEPAPEYDPRLLDAYIFDLDGTLALKHESRDIYDASKAYLDYPNKPVVNILNVLAFDDCTADRRAGEVTIYCTARHEQDRAATVAWLERHTPFDPEHGDLLLMRQEKGVKDSKIKLDLYNEHIRGKYNVLGIWDDRQQVVDMWRELGLQVYQVAPGDF